MPHARPSNMTDALVDAYKGFPAGASIPKPLLICDCDTEWTAVNANCVPLTNPTYYKQGVFSSVLIVSDGTGTAGHAAYSGIAVSNLNIRNYTHVAFWIRSIVTIPAGLLRFGFSNAADASGTEHYIDIPAVPSADTWYRCVLPLSLLGSALSQLYSVDSVHLYITDDLTAGLTIYLDDVVLYNMTLTGGIETVPMCTISNANTVSAMPVLLKLNRMPSYFSAYDMPVKCNFYWMNEDQTVNGITRLTSGQTAADLRRTSPLLGVAPAGVIPSGSSIDLEVV